MDYITTDHLLYQLHPKKSLKVSPTKTILNYSCTCLEFKKAW